MLVWGGILIRSYEFALELLAFCFSTASNSGGALATYLNAIERLKAAVYTTERLV